MPYSIRSKVSANRNHPFRSKGITSEAQAHAYGDLVMHAGHVSLNDEIGELRMHKNALVWNLNADTSELKKQEGAGSEEALDAQGDPRFLSGAIDFSLARMGFLKRCFKDKRISSGDTLECQSADPALLSHAFELHSILKPRNKPEWTLKTDTLSFSSVEECTFWYDLISEMIRSQSERPKKLLVFVNPYGGRRKAEYIYDHYARELFANARIDTKVIVTTYAEEAKDIMTTTNLSLYDGVVICGGDGFLNQCINALLSRPDRDLFNTLRFGMIPGGSTNTVALSVHGTDDIVTSILKIIAGNRQPLDLCKTTTLHGDHLTYSASMVAYGFYAEGVNKAEGFRFMGPMRYDVTGFEQFMRLNAHECIIRFKRAAPRTKATAIGTATATATAPAANNRPGHKQSERAHTRSASHLPSSSPTPTRTHTSDKFSHLMARSAETILPASETTPSEQPSHMNSPDLSQWMGGGANPHLCLRGCKSCLPDPPHAVPISSVRRSESSNSLRSLNLGTGDCSHKENGSATRKPKTSILKKVMSKRLTSTKSKSLGKQGSHGHSRTQANADTDTAIFVARDIADDCAETADQQNATDDDVQLKAHSDHTTPDGIATLTQSDHMDHTAITATNTDGSAPGDASREASGLALDHTTVSSVDSSRTVPAVGATAEPLEESEGLTFSDIEEGTDADGWEVRKGNFIAINALSMSCKHPKSVNGMAPFAHLSDGTMLLVMVRQCSRPKYLKHLLTVQNPKANHFDDDVLEGANVSEFEVKAISKPSVWMADGEVIEGITDVHCSAHYNLIHYFGSRPAVPPPTIPSSVFRDKSREYP
ncbi:hypothetical protein, variant [Sphaeroforma arctica JP610]|nr:hypothetical protein, variant [Sphaeroforma arctica JP610]KNC86645.1 hypothetical protein, variant [Sphaeroforma arctica JP610]|eukprot:XP_014160547.1 hypothetical protein, variant [Sphaeroforma arctica JP610]